MFRLKTEPDFLFYNTEAKSPAPEPPSSTNLIADARGERIIVGREKEKNGQSSPQLQSRLSSEVLRRFEEKSREASSRPRATISFYV